MLNVIISIFDKIPWAIMKNLGKGVFALYCKINNSLIFVDLSWFHSKDEGMLSLENVLSLNFRFQAAFLK